MDREMDNAPVREVFEELFMLLEALESQNAAVLQLLKDEGTITDEKLAPYLEQAGRASDVRWRAARARMEYLFNPMKKAPDEKKEPESDKAPEPNKQPEKPAPEESKEKQEAQAPEGKQQAEESKGKKEQTTEKAASEKQGVEMNGEKVKREKKVGSGSPPVAVKEKADKDGRA
jgi:outer membrane biosynthesis protein TonB